MCVVFFYTFRKRVDLLNNVSLRRYLAEDRIL